MVVSGVLMSIRWVTITLLLAATSLVTLACNIPFDFGGNGGGSAKPDVPPTYAVVRLRHETRVEMLTLMETYGEGACDVAISEFTSAVFENPADMEGWRETERDCRDTLSPLNTRIFNNEQVHATYLKIAVKEAWEYESRIIIYGVPASQALPVCEEMAKSLQTTLQATAECVKGTEG